jgi:rubredoxin
VKQRQVGVWHGAGVSPSGHQVKVSFTLPDYGDAPTLYQCAHCADLVVIDPDVEHYIGPAWDSLREEALCPSCSKALADCWLYPDHFRCPLCGAVSTFELPDSCPPDSERAVQKAWDRS